MDAASARLRRRARRAVRVAVRRGLLARSACQRCGATPAQAHHPDYARPLDVEWLCVPCHADAHHGAPAGNGEPALAELVRSLRGAESQARFADRLGVDQSDVSRFLRGRRGAGTEFIYGLFRAFPQRGTDIADALLADESARVGADPTTGAGAVSVPDVTRPFTGADSTAPTQEVDISQTA